MGDHIRKGSTHWASIRMDLSDEDLFPVSDEDETIQPSSTRNPVEEHLLKQMHETTERIEKARSNADEIRGLTEKVLKKLHIRETCGVSSDSDTDSESYQVTAEPVIKNKRQRRIRRSQPLEIHDVWQQVIDDKWIVGIVLKNKRDRILTDPRVYVIVKGETEIRGISSFWKIIDSTSTRSDELAPEVDKNVATVVLDLPNFASSEAFEAFATVSYTLGEKKFQTPVPTFHLRVNDVIERNFAPKFSVNMENSVLAIKSISVERELVIPIDKEDIGGRLFAFLEANGFKNVADEIPDVYVAKNKEFYRHCIFEILTISDIAAPVRISARTPSHLEVIVRLLRDTFADVVLTDTEDRAIEAARALERELELELAGSDTGTLHMARTITDLLIP